ncbi:MAG: hypothetical protein FWD13_06775 [Treponema sp.]|nr:hypothetical protein [Treponema sp.]
MVKTFFIITLLVVGLNIATAQNIPQYQNEIENLINDFQSGRITAQEMGNRSSMIAANINSGNIREDARNDIAWRRQWITLITELEQYLDNLYKTQSVPYTLFYSNNINQGAINYQNETISLSIQTNIRANETWLLPVHQVVNAVFDGLLETERRNDWGLNNWPWTSVTTLNPFSSRQSINFNISAELVNDRGQVIGRQTFQATSAWSWVNDRNLYNISNSISDRRRAPTLLVNNNIQNNVVFNVKVDDITDNLIMRIVNVNGVEADRAVRDGLLQIVVMTGEEYTINNNFEFRFGRLSGHQNRSYSGNLVIPATMWGETVTFVGDRQFQYPRSFTSLTIPDNIYIAEYAFLTNDNITINIGENVNINVNSLRLNGFNQYYNDNGKRAGTYIFTQQGRRGGSWSYTPRR